MIRVYAYKNCDSCRKALRWLADHHLPHEVLPIRETPPAIAELRIALNSAGGDLRKLFNTSGSDYRDLNLKDRLPTLSQDEALTLLHSNGNLVKRPLLLHGNTATNGFHEPTWSSLLLTPG